MADLGIRPFAGYGLFLVCFTGFSFYLFSRLSFAPYVYLLLSFGLTLKLSEVRRNDFLKMCFSGKDYLVLRLTENMIVALPFAIFLACKLLLLPLIILLVISALLSLFSNRNTFRFVLPTPFYKKPFEFTVGFRNTFYLIAGSYCLTFIAIAVDNLNLGIFSMLSVFLIIFSYYIRPEPEYYIWSHELTAKQFIAEKIKTGLLFSLLLCMPVLAALLGFYFSHAWLILLCMLAGYVYLTVIILAKYSAYPDEMNLPQAFLIAFSVSFPPLLLFVIPYLFQQSVKRLQKLLA